MLSMLLGYLPPPLLLPQHYLALVLKLSQLLLLVLMLSWPVVVMLMLSWMLLLMLKLSLPEVVLMLSLPELMLSQWAKKVPTWNPH